MQGLSPAGKKLGNFTLLVGMWDHEGPGKTDLSRELMGSFECGFKRDSAIRFELILLSVCLLMRCFI